MGFSLSNPGGTGTANLPNAMFQVIKIGSQYQAQSTTGLIGTYADVVQAITACINITSQPATILLDPAADGDGLTLTINKSYITISTDTLQSMESGSDWWKSPRITKIVIDSTAGEIRETYIKGMCMRQLDFYANGHAITGAKFENCGFRADGSANGKGIRFLGASIIYYVRFIDCQAYDLYDQTSDTLGMISFQQTANVGTGQIYFYNLIYKPGTNGATFFCVNTSCRFDQDVLFQNLNYVNTGRTGVKVFYFKDGSKSGGGTGALKILGSSFEMHVSTTIFTMDSGHSSATQHRAIVFSENTGSCGDDAGQTLTFITNNAADLDYYTGTQSYMEGKTNKFIAEGTLGTFSVGTSGACTHFIFDVGYTYWRGTTETNSNSTKG